LRLLVTGGLGFIGSNLIRHLLSTREDIEIINLDNLSKGSNPSNLVDEQENRRYNFVKGDIRDRTVIEELVRNVDAVVNMAAESHVDRSIVDPTHFYENNLIGTLTILEAVRKTRRDLRILQVSTDEVYGDIAEGSSKETDALRPSSPYSASKAACDLAVLAHHRTFGLDAVITRCTNNFGPYQFPEKLIPKTIVRSAMNMAIPIYGSGRNIRDWIHVTDHCSAIENVLEKGKTGQTYNISSGNEHTNIGIVNKILDIMGKSRDLISHVEDRPGHDLRYSLDSARIRGELNWRPQHPFESAIEKTIGWYLNNEKWWKPLATEEVLSPTPWKDKK
jgi:dTDP-glucose 4,6-dehydratase